MAQSQERASNEKEEQLNTPNEEVLEDDSDDYQNQAETGYRNSISISDKFKPKILYNKQTKNNKLN